MYLKLINLRYSAAHGGLDDQPLQEFTRDKQVLSFREYFYLAGRVPHLACVVTYQLPNGVAIPAAPAEAHPAPPGRTPGGNRNDAAAGPLDPELRPEDRALFERLRRWRAEHAARLNRPAYRVLTNRQIGVIVKARPESVEQLGELEGIGKATLANFGEELVRLLRTG
ncbi:MAG: HRDC domain-containing protein [Planctomycetota bacterium]